MNELDIFEGFMTTNNNEEDTPYNYLLKKSMANKNQPVIISPTNQHYITSIPIYCQHHHCHDQLVYSSQFMNQTELIVPLSPISNSVYPTTAITSSSYQSLTPASLPDNSFMDFSSSYLSPNLNQNQIIESLTSTCTNNEYDYNHSSSYSFYPTPPPSIPSFTQNNHITSIPIPSSQHQQQQQQQQPSIQVLSSSSSSCSSSLSNSNSNSLIFNNTSSSITSSPSLSSTSSPALSTLSTSSLSSSSSLLNTKHKKKLNKEKIDSPSSPSSYKKKKKNQQESTTTTTTTTTITTPSSLPAKIYACEFCDKVFYRAYNLKSHRLSHSKIRPYVCRYDGCPWRFSRPHDLRRHEHLHAGHRPYGCTSCGKRFSRLDALERHARGDAVCQKVASMLAHAALISNNNQLSLPKKKQSVSSSSVAFVNNDQNDKKDIHSNDSLSSYSLSTHLFSVSPSFSHF